VERRRVISVIERTECTCVCVVLAMIREVKSTT